MNIEDANDILNNIQHLEYTDILQADSIVLDGNFSISDLEIILAILKSVRE